MDDRYHDPVVETIQFVFSMQSKMASFQDKEIYIRIEGLSKDQLKRIQDIVGERIELWIE